MKVLLRSIFISTIIFSITEKVFGTLVETPSGSINGTVIYFKDIPVKTFLGIPYAEKPVGSLRFQKPQPVKRWNTTLQATEFPPQCVQFSTAPFPFYYNLTDLSEDCLYLNIWVPEIRDGDCKKSVMFWIHGGGFRISSTLIDFYHGQALAAEGDVVVVTTNYRLGVEGFLFSDTEDAPGNMGLWDIVEALKWVRNNIQYFGGDPDSITLFGQSAGGIAIGMLCTSPVARDGLFQRIIMQSGSPASSAGDDNDSSFRISQQVAAFVGCAESDEDLKRDPEAVVQCLRGKNALELAKALSNVTSGSPRSYYPRYGDDLLPKNPREAIINGEFEPFDVLIGSNDGDGASLITKSMRDVFGFFGEKDPQINKTFGSSIIRDKFKSFPEPDAVVEQYLGGVEEDNYDEIRLRVFTASGDYARTCPSNYFAESFAEKKVLVYNYFFVHRPSVTPWAPWMLAVHHDETPFVFGYPLRHPDRYDEADQILSRRMIRAWTTFAKTGIPEYGDWPQYSKQSPRFLVIDNETHIGEKGPHQENCDFFRPYLGFE